MQMSEAFITSIFLALSGGFQDAYTYFTRDGVFSNAQTGNVVLMSQHFMMKEWSKGFHYLLPLFAFAAGVFAAEQIQSKFRYAKKLHWRQGILLFCFLSVLFLLLLMWQLQPWYPLPVPCRFRLSARSAAIPTPAPCVLATFAVVPQPCLFISENIKRTSCASPYITLVLFCSLPSVPVSEVICPPITDSIQSGSLMDCYVSASC